MLEVVNRCLHPERFYGVLRQKRIKAKRGKR